MRFSPSAALPCGLFDRTIAINLTAKYWARVAIRRPLHSSSSSDTKHPVSTPRLRCKWHSLPFPFFLFLFRRARHKRTNWWNQKCRSWPHNWDQLRQQTRYPQSDKGEKNSSIFIFTRVPSRDKRIFTSSAKKLPSNIHFPRIRYAAINVRMHENDVFFLSIWIY